MKERLTRFLPDRAAHSNADQTFSSSARQNNDTGSGSSIAKHFSAGLLLIWPQNGHWLKVDVDIWIDGVVTEVVLGQQRKVKLHRTLLQRFQLLLINFKRDCDFFLLLFRLSFSRLCIDSRSFFFLLIIVVIIFSLFSGKKSRCLQARFCLVLA